MYRERLQSIRDRRVKIIRQQLGHLAVPSHMFEECVGQAEEVFNTFRSVNTSVAVGFYLVSRRQGEPFILKNVAATLLLKEGQLKRKISKYLKEHSIPQPNPKLKYKILDRLMQLYGEQDQQIRSKTIALVEEIGLVNNRIVTQAYAATLEKLEIVVNYSKLSQIAGQKIKRLKDQALALPSNSSKQSTKVNPFSETEYWKARGRILHLMHRQPLSHDGLPSQNLLDIEKNILSEEIGSSQSKYLTV